MQDSHNNLVAATMARWISWAFRDKSADILSNLRKIEEEYSPEGDGPELAHIFAFLDITITLMWILSWYLRRMLYPRDPQLSSGQPTKEDVVREIKLLRESCRDYIPSWMGGFQSHVPELMMRDQEQIEEIVRDLVPLLFSADELVCLQSWLENERQAAAVVAILRVHGFLGPN